MKLQEKQKKQAGITLVALVVTIIILIILATISIRMVIGEGGLIWQANNGKIEYRAAEVEEEVLAWKTEKKLAKYADEIQPMNRDAFIDDQASRGLLTQEEAEDAKEDGQVQIGSKVIDYGKEVEEDSPTPPVEPTLKVALEVTEEQVTGTTIPVKAKVVKIDGEEEVTEGVQYQFYKNEAPDGESSEAGTHTFDDLEETEEYTLRVVATDVNGEVVENTVTVGVLKIYYDQFMGDRFKTVYLRYTLGMTWEEFLNSQYNKNITEDKPLKICSGTWKKPTTYNPEQNVDAVGLQDGFSSTGYLGVLCEFTADTHSLTSRLALPSIPCGYVMQFDGTLTPSKPYR